MLYLTNGCCENVGNEELPEKYQEFIYDIFVQWFLAAYTIKHDGIIYHAPHREYNFHNEEIAESVECEDEPVIRALVEFHQKILRERELETHIEYYDVLGDRHTLIVLIPMEWIYRTFNNCEQYSVYLNEILKMEKDDE